MADTYVATQDLYIGLAKAHSAGEEVSAERVEQWGWQNQVAKKGTKAATEVTGDK